MIFAGGRLPRRALFYLLLLGAQACGGANDGPYVVSSWQKEMSEGQKALEGKKFAEAERLYRLALREAQGSGGDELLLAQTLNNLASAEKGEGKYDEAEPLYLRALAIFEKLQGPRSEDAATVLRNYISLLNAAERPGDAIHFEKRLAEMSYNAAPTDVNAVPGPIQDAPPTDGSPEQMSQSRDGSPVEGSHAKDGTARQGAETARSHGSGDHGIGSGAKL